MKSQAGHRLQYPRRRIACWIPKDTNTHSEHVILTACPLQQRLHERAVMLSYTYIACLFKTHTGCVYCAVRAESSNMLQVNFQFQSVKQRSVSLLEIRMIVVEHVLQLWKRESLVPLGIKIHSPSPRAIRYSPLTVTPVPYHSCISLHIHHDSRNKCETIDYTAWIAKLRGAEMIQLPYQAYQVASINTSLLSNLYLDIYVKM